MTASRYADAAPTLRKILNQATHDRIAPVLHDDDDRHACRIIGQRDPVYVAIDKILGKTPPESLHALNETQDGQEGSEKTMAPISRGHGSDESKMAEGEGFEPSRPVNPA